MTDTATATPSATDQDDSDQDPDDTIHYFQGDDIDAMNRSLATLGEQLDIEAIHAACRSEQVAS